MSQFGMFSDPCRDGAESDWLSGREDHGQDYDGHLPCQMPAAANTELNDQPDKAA